MNFPSTTVVHILEKTVLFELSSVYNSRNVKVDFPVSCNGTVETHSWEFDWIWSLRKLDCGHRTFDFTLSGKQTNNFKYEKSVFKIKILIKNGVRDVVLTEGTGDLVGDDRNQFKFAKDGIITKKSTFDNAMVQVTLQSCVTENPPLNTFKKMLDRDSLTDVAIKTKGKEFRCHKVVLASQSEYFEKMFESDMKEKNESVVNWVDVFDGKVVRDMLHFVYTGQPPPNLANTCLPLLEIAHMCFMDGLKALCIHQLKKDINVKNMGGILRVAAKYDSEDLQETAINFIVQNYDLKEGNSPHPWDNVEPVFLKSLTNTMFKVMVTKKVFPLSSPFKNFLSNSMKSFR